MSDSHGCFCLPCLSVSELCLFCGLDTCLIDIIRAVGTVAAQQGGGVCVGCFSSTTGKKN